MLNYSGTSENVCLAFNQHIGLKDKKFENLVHLTFKDCLEHILPTLTDLISQFGLPAVNLKIACDWERIRTKDEPTALAFGAEQLSVPVKLTMKEEIIRKKNTKVFLP